MVIFKIFYILKLISLTISTFLFSALILIIIRSRYIQDIWSFNFRWRNLWESFEFDYDYYRQKFNEAENVISQNPTQALMIVLEVFEKYLNYLGYEGKNLKERFAKVPREKLTYYDDLEKLINEKIYEKEINSAEAETLIKKIKFSFKQLNLDLDELNLDLDKPTQD